MINSILEKVKIDEMSVEEAASILSEYHTLLERFVSAAQLQRHAISTGCLEHAIWCNFRHSSRPTCNCGISNLQSALIEYEKLEGK